MTVYYPNGKRCELVRASVERERNASRDLAVSIEAGRSYRDLDDDDRREWAANLRKNAARLDKVLECVDNGVAELPQELYP